MKKLIFYFILILNISNTWAQIPNLQNIKITNGFAHKITGDDFSYYSSIPMAKECLLIRATDGNSSMEWQTEAVPEKLEDEYVTFVWLAGLGSSPGKASFGLEINGKPAFEFWADGKDEWKLENPDGKTLSFKKDMVDQHGDRFGFMYLKIPANQLEKGKPLNLKVTGGNFDLTSWYMTFKFEIKNGLSFKSFPAIAETDGKEYQLGVAGVLHFGNPGPAKIFIEDKLVKEENVNFGYNYLKVNLPTVEEDKTVNYRLEVGDFNEEGQLNLKPVKKWRVNFVQHSHTDIGYTRPQTEILAEHLRYIDYALDYCDNTDSYPDNAKFRWTCEATWPVDEYLNSRPQSQIERLKKRVVEGRIELTGMYFNFDGLPDEQVLAASLQPIKNFRENGLDVKVAMQNDVNGIGWCLNEYYSDLGVKYLNMGTHGHRALIAFDKPTLFWWESPSGKRMLAYRAEHYMTGNTVFKIHAGDFNVFENELLTYLTDLEAKGYEYDLISIQHSGFLTDNSPPSTLASDMIRTWNEKYTWPKLKTATTTEFFEEMEAKHGSEFRVIRGAWPDWWTDGFGASAREVATTREALTDLIANNVGLTMAALQGSELPKNIDFKTDETNSALLFYTEHTVGYHGSVREPFSKNTMEQRALKESYAWEAGRRAKIIREETLGLLQSHVERAAEPTLLVYNTLNWQRSGLFTVYIDHQIIPRDRNFKLIDASGKQAYAQPIERHSDGTYWAIWANDVPAFGYKKYFIEVPENELWPETFGIGVKETMENSWYKIKIDTEKGTISSLVDKQLNKELVNQDAKYQLGEFIYELLDNRSQMEAYRLDNFTRESLEKVWFDGYEESPVWNTIRFKGNTKAAIADGDFVFEIRLFNTTKRIDLYYSIQKKSVTDPEGIYIAFPFQLNDGVLAFDVQGGEIRAGIDQIPGSSNDWNSVQNYARLSNKDAQIILSSKEIPLMQFGGINTGRYQAGATPETTHIFGWPMNNYWVTNFNAEQSGGHTWTYTISSNPENHRQDAVRFGWSNRIPFLTRVLPGGGKGEDQNSGTFISGWPENVLLINSIPSIDGNSVVIQVREINGQNATLHLINGLTQEEIYLKQVNVLGENIENGSVTLKPFESKFFRILF
ncbi:glycoside hydrolase family 38 C-terminal domain-containing protein [Maribellus sediminis]|uniref:glycoside hydrolase family 38 N-terminal domain-containing protein n=1 Tax=Maribellus sediminis TaxID=2696285 RepID=UPI001431618F|nr:glycoside hydrolase family 38 C-terminal domain-containing protein [Maribellus sediminis]